MCKEIRSSWLTGRWTRKEYSEKMEGQGRGEAQGVSDKKSSFVPTYIVIDFLDLVFQVKVYILFFIFIHIYTFQQPPISSI
jgi:hypothetical protein